MTEIWKPVRDWEDLYEVSSLGAVRSKDRIAYDAPNARHLRYKGRVLKPCASSGGYLQVVFSRDGKHTNKSVHRMVLEAFKGLAPAGMVSCHEDGDQKNNLPGNLRWGTQSSNIMDKIKHGTDDRGSKNPSSVLDEAQVLAIRLALGSGERGIGRKLAKKYGVSASIISAINVGKRWAHL